MRRDFDPASLVAGLAISGFGVLLLLDQVDTIDLRFGYFFPAILGGSEVYLCWVVGEPEIRLSREEIVLPRPGTLSFGQPAGPAHPGVRFSFL